MLPGRRVEYDRETDSTPSQVEYALNHQQAFDEKAESWNTSRDLPWNRLRYELTHELIRRHLPVRTPRLLEIGCGNGYEASLWNGVASQITVSDLSANMLETARSLFSRLGVETDVEFVHADVTSLPGRIAGDFDLILYHNVIEYVPDPTESLRAIGALLSDGGLLSVRHINRYSNALIPAMYESDLSTTMEYLNSPVIRTSFGTEVTTFTRSQIRRFLEDSGYELSQSYGVMSLTGYMTDNEPKYDPAFYAQLKEIELRMADTFPYYETARFGLFIAQRAGASDCKTAL